MATAGSAFSPMEPNDHAGAIWIVGILGLMYALLSGGARIYIKRRAYDWDDYILVLATILYAAQAALILQALRYGLAKYNSITTEEQWQTSGKMVFYADIISILISYLAKCSTVSLIIRVLTFEADIGWKICSALQVFNIILGMASIVALAVRCQPNMIFEDLAQCLHLYLRWGIVTAFDVLTDLLAFFCLVGLVWQLNMSMKTKMQVFLAFGCRLPLVGLSIYRLAAMRGYISSAEPQFAITGFLLSQQTLLTWSLISSTIPNIGSFMRSFSTDFGVPTLGRGAETNDLETVFALRTIGGSFARYSARRGNSRVVSSHPEIPLHTLRADGPIHKAVVHSSASDQPEVASRSGSQELIIKKDIAWDVHHESL